MNAISIRLALIVLLASCGATTCSESTCIDAGLTTDGGGSAVSGGGVSGGGTAATGGGSASVGGGSVATGGGSTSQGGGTATTGGGSALTDGGVMEGSHCGSNADCAPAMVCNLTVANPFCYCAGINHLCGMACVSNTSVDHCGQSCVACPQPANSTASCTAQKCGFTCTQGLTGLGLACVSSAEFSYLKASNTESLDQFSAAVALSADGNTLAIGAPSEDSISTGINGDQSNNTENNAGAVYVFTRSGAAWVQQAYVKASNANSQHTGQMFGNAIALSADGNTMLVGSQFESSNATGVNSANQLDYSEPFAGAAFVFTRSGSIWAQQAYLKAANSYQGAHFGISVALSADGNTAAIGSDGEKSSTTGINTTPDRNRSSAGAAYVFSRAGTTWTQQAYVKASNTENADFFGTSVALSGDGNTLGVGATGEDSNATGIGGSQTNNMAANSGAVYVYARSGTVWAQQAYVKSDVTRSVDALGSALAFSNDGNTLAAGASGASAVILFGRSGTTWSQLQALRNTSVPAISFGQTLALSSDGSTLAVGAPTESSNAAGLNGDASNTVGTSSGAVFVLTRAGSTWTQQTYVKASNPDRYDRFASSVSISGDGHALAVGAISEASRATGVNGDQNDNSSSSSGAVYWYHLP